MNELVEWLVHMVACVVGLEKLWDELVGWFVNIIAYAVGGGLLGGLWVA